MPNHITVDGDYKFNIDQRVVFMKQVWCVKHRYTERFARNQVDAIARYVIHDEASNQLTTVSEVTLTGV